MGFGCNACGVTGCHIIDSPRERLIAMLTNSLVPCNGRFPLLITLLTAFLSGEAMLGASAGLLASLVLSVCVTLLVSRLLSATLLRGESSSSCRPTAVRAWGRCWCALFWIGRSSSSAAR